MSRSRKWLVGTVVAAVVAFVLLLLLLPLLKGPNAGQARPPGGVDLSDDPTAVPAGDIAWGPVANDGLQFGVTAEKGQYQLRDRMRLEVYARNTSDRPITFEFPRLSTVWPHGKLKFRDARGEQLVAHRLQGGNEFLRRRFELAPQAVVLVGVEKVYLHGLAMDGTPAGDYVNLVPGNCSFGFVDLHAPASPAWPTGMTRVTVTTPPIVPRIVEAKPELIGWGREADGLQFGLALDPASPATIHIGDVATFQLFVRNVSDGEKEFEHTFVNGLASYAEPRATPGGSYFVSWKDQVRPYRTRSKVPPRATHCVGRFSLPVSAARSSNVGWHVTAEPGACDISFPSLTGWLTADGYSTGSVRLEVKRGDEPHVGADGISWGPVVDGKQFGIRFGTWDLPTIDAGESFSVATFTRNWGTEPLDLQLCMTADCTSVGSIPTVSIDGGRDIPFTPRTADAAPIRGPVWVKVTIPAGDYREFRTSNWLTLAPNDIPPSGDGYFVLTPGRYTVRFDMLQPGAAPVIPTGELRLVMR